MCPGRGNVPTLGRPPAKQPCNARRETVRLSKCPFVCRSASLPAFLGRRQVASRTSGLVVPSAMTDVSVPATQDRV